MTVHPKLQMSDAVVAPDSSMTSGAIQYGVPTTLDSLNPVVRLATPKSASLTRPSFVVKMLAPLISRWITPCSCRYKSPCRTWDIYKPTKFSGNRPKFLAMECNEPFSQYLHIQNQPFRITSAIHHHSGTYSKIMFKVSADFTNPWYLTIFGCYCLGQREFVARHVGFLTSRFFSRSISS